MAINSQDFKRNVDFDAQAQISGSLINQGFDTAEANPDSDTALDGIGLAICTTDSALDTPQVPDPTQGVSYNKWKRYQWVRKPHDTAPSEDRPIIYAWNSAAGEDPTFLQWQDTRQDITALEAAVAANTLSIVNISIQSTQASADASNALTTSQAANTTATTAANSVAAATAAATAASLAATTALATANSASTTATAANASASAAVTQSATALAAAQAAQAGVNTLNQLHRHTTFDVAGVYGWICPGGVTSIRVKVWGAGGSGGQSTSGGTFAGGGGGAGGYSESVIVSTPGTTYSLTVGAGGAVPGASGTVGVGGGDSLWGASVVVAKGGGGGGNHTDGVAGAGGILGTGDTTIVGLAGFAGANGGNGGQGGNSQNGGGGGKGATNLVTIASAGMGPSGGGGGSYRSAYSSLLGHAGAGADGQVSIEWVV